MIKKLSAFIVFVAATAHLLQPVFSDARHIPGSTNEEWVLNAKILQSTDEPEVYGYLSNANASARLSACLRLNEIGTSYSLPGLENAAALDEDPEVKERASLVLWNIKYKDELSMGRDGSQALLPILVKDEDPTKTPAVKTWSMGLLGDMACAQALPL